MNASDSQSALPCSTLYAKMMIHRFFQCSCKEVMLTQRDDVNQYNLIISSKTDIKEMARKHLIINKQKGGGN